MCGNLLHFQKSRRVNNQSPTEFLGHLFLQDIKKSDIKTNVNFPLQLPKVPSGQAWWCGNSAPSSRRKKKRREQILKFLCRNEMVRKQKKKRSGKWMCKHFMKSLPGTLVGRSHWEQWLGDFFATFGAFLRLFCEKDFRKALFSRKRRKDIGNSDLATFGDFLRIFATSFWEKKTSRRGTPLFQ